MALGIMERICNKMNYTFISLCMKLNSKWIKDSGLIEEKLSPNLDHISLESDFLNKTPKVQEVKSRIDKWDGFKLKSCFFAKETINNVKREPTN